MTLAPRNLLRAVLVSALAASLAMIAARVGRYPALLPLPGAGTLLVEAVGLLLIFLALVIWGTRPAHPLSADLLRRSTIIGLAGAALQIVHVILEHFGTLPASWNGPFAIVSMLATFALWGAASFLARREAEPLLGSVWSSVWSAIVTMTLLIPVGVALELYLAPTPLEVMSSWGEFQRSGWSDLAAFAIANTLDSVSSHLFIGPVVAAIVGGIGSLLGGLRRPAVARRSEIPQ